MTWDNYAYRSETHGPCPICNGLGCDVCNGSGRMRIRPTRSGTLHDFPDIDLDREKGGYLYNIGVRMGCPPPPEPYRLPDQMCQTCFNTKFGEQLANTFCFDAKWIILGHDDYTGTKNPIDIHTERGVLPAEPPRFMWARGMWGIQIRYYKDTNA